MHVALLGGLAGDCGDARGASQETDAGEQPVVLRLLLHVAPFPQ